MFVDVEADAVAEAMSEEFIAGAVAGGINNGAGGVVNGARKFSGAGGVECGVLGFANGFERALNFFAGLAEDAGARDVGAVAFDGAAVINQNNIAFFQCARLLAAMRQGGAGAEEDERIAAEMELRITEPDQFPDLPVAHYF